MQNNSKRLHIFFIFIYPNGNTAGLPRGMGAFMASFGKIPFWLPAERCGPDSSWISQKVEGSLIIGLGSCKIEKSEDCFFSTEVISPLMGSLL